MSIRVFKHTQRQLASALAGLFQLERQGEFPGSQIVLSKLHRQVKRLVRRNRNALRKAVSVCRKKPRADYEPCPKCGSRFNMALDLADRQIRVSHRKCGFTGPVVSDDIEFADIVAILAWNAIPSGAV